MTSVDLSSRLALATACSLSACSAVIESPESPESQAGRPSVEAPGPSRPGESAEAPPTGPGAAPEDPVLPASNCRPPRARLWQLSPQQLGLTFSQVIPGADPLEIEARMTRFASAGAPYTADPSIINASQQYASELFKAIGAEVARADLADIHPCLGAENISGCLPAFFDELGTQLFRMPLDAAVRSELAARFTVDEADYGRNVASALLLRRMLIAPEVQFRAERGVTATEEPMIYELGPFELASQIAFTLTDAPPDAELWAAAVDGSILQPEVHEAQVRRLLATPPAPEAVSLPNNNAIRNVKGLLRFFREWLDVDRIRLSPHGGSGDLASRRRRWFDNETMLFLRHALWEAEGTLRYILTSDQSTYSNTLADFYGFERDPDASSSDLRPTTDGRKGILMHAGFLVSHHSATMRGLFIRERMLCQPLRAPEEADMNLPGLEQILEEEEGRNLSPREVRARHLADPDCSGCHELIDPLGFPFDGFGTFGEPRDEWDGFPIDTAGYIAGTTSTDGTVEDARALVDVLADSADVRSCFVRQLYRFVHGRTPAQEDRCYLERLERGFEESGGNVRELLVDMMTGDEMRLRTVVTE